MKFTKAWFVLSWHWLWGRGSRTPPGRKDLLRNSVPVALVSLGMGVASLSLVSAIVSGFEYQLAQSVRKAQGDLVYFSKWRTREEWAALIHQVFPAGFQGDIERIELFWTTQGLMVGPKGGRGAMIEGRSLWPESEGEPLQGQVQLTLGANLADYLGVEELKNVRLLLPGVLKSPVVGKVESKIRFGMHLIDSRYVRVEHEPLEAWMRQNEPEALENRPGDFHALRIFFKSSLQGPDGLVALETWQKNFQEKLIANGWEGDTPGPDVRNWKEQRLNLFGAVESERGTLGLIFKILTLVASLNICALLLVLFIERDKDFSLLRAVGMARAQFVSWMLVVGLLLGVGGSCVGMGLSFLLGQILIHTPIAQLPSEIYNISHLPLRYVFHEQAMAFGFGILMSLLLAGFMGLRLSKWTFNQRRSV